MRPATAAKWEAAWRSCPYATDFQSPGWAVDWSGYADGVLCPERHAAYWRGAAPADCFELRPANLLVCELVVDACVRGLDWLDLNPGGGRMGVDVFKQHIGAESLSCPIIKRERGRDLFLDRLLKPPERGPVAGA